MAYEEYPPDHYQQPGDMSTTAYIFDIDGTLATRDESDPNVRIPYDYTRVSEDLPVPDVIFMANLIMGAGHALIFVSGRSETCRLETERWLWRWAGMPTGVWGGDYDFPLYMRPAGDRRPDTIIKRELFDKHIRPAGYYIAGVFDDRNRVVRKTWRDQLGLTCYHVADHDF